jgi:energy-coupling factor transport system substrate-specific component
VTKPVVPLGRRSSVFLAVVSVIGLAAFAWPLVVPPSGRSELAHSGDAPWLFAVVLPLLLALVLAELSDGVIDAKAVAVLGVLVAGGAVLRIPSGGVTGFTMLFLLLIPAARVFGAGFGFVLGALTIFASALLTGGVGPWLPFQMFGAGWVGLFAGCLPRARGRTEITLLAAYGALAGLAYGLLLDLWFWPFLASGSELSFVPGADLADNLGRFWAFHVATSLGFDLPRAVGNAVLMVVAAGPVMTVLARTARRAAFDAQATFVAASGEWRGPLQFGTAAVAPRDVEAATPSGGAAGHVSEPVAPVGSGGVGDARAVVGHEEPELVVGLHEDLDPLRLGVLGDVGERLPRNDQQLGREVVGDH